MAQSKLRLLSKLREFRSGMDVEKYLTGEFRQNLKAIEDALRGDDVADTVGSIGTVAEYIPEYDTTYPFLNTYSSTSLEEIASVSIRKSSRPVMLSIQGNPEVMDRSINRVFSISVDTADGGTYLFYFVRNLGKPDEKEIHSFGIRSTIASLSSDADGDISRGEYCIDIDAVSGDFTYTLLAAGGTGTVVRMICWKLVAVAL